MLEDSFTFAPWSAANLMNLLLVIGRTVVREILEDEAAGSRKGNAPVGEA